jgi:hypothetical protein
MQVRARTEELEQRNKQLAEARARLAEEKLSLERSEAYLAEAQRLSKLEVGTGMSAPANSSGRKSALQSSVLIQKRPKPRYRCISSASIRKIAPGLSRLGWQLLEREGILKMSTGSFSPEAPSNTCTALVAARWANPAILNTSAQ